MPAIDSGSYYHRTQLKVAANKPPYTGEHKIVPACMATGAVPRDSMSPPACPSQSLCAFVSSVGRLPYHHITFYEIHCHALPQTPKPCQSAKIPQGSKFWSLLRESEIQFVPLRTKIGPFVKTWGNPAGGLDTLQGLALWLRSNTRRPILVM
jgi:hypothetical protein